MSRQRHPRKILERTFGPGFPAWSADGRTVIVSTLRPYSGRYREGMNYMLALPLDDSASRTIVPVEHSPIGKRSGDGPVWSPDGTHIAYVANGYLTVMPVAPNGEPAGPPRQITKELRMRRASWRRRPTIRTSCRVKLRRQVPEVPRVPPHPVAPGRT